MLGPARMARGQGGGAAQTGLARWGDSHCSTSEPPRSAQAIAISGGQITYVGDNAGAASHIGPATEVIDPGGRMVMPGIHDGHVHTLGGGQALTAPSLNYRQLRLSQFVDRIAKLLARTRADEPDTWLVVGEWDAQSM